MSSSDTVVISSVEAQEPGGESVRAWLCDHAVAAVAVVVTLLAAAGYCVHRSWLFGWYQAAGIPAFAHGWAAQDVVMQGVTNLTVWLFSLVAVAVMTIAVYIEVVAIASAERWWDRRRAARKVALSEDKGSGKSNGVWTNLGAHAAVCGMVVAGAVLLYCSIALAVVLFSSVPRNLGHQQFLETNAFAETTIRAATTSAGEARVAPKELEDARKHMNDRYRYVLATVGVGEAATRHCGWLVLQNGEHMLLLTRGGPLFLSASGLGFSWYPTKIDDC